MVTTRSAERKATLDGKTESLALRAKLEDGASATESFDSDTSLSNTARKSKIIVQVPPPKKRTRSTHNGANDEQQEQQIDTSEVEISQLENAAVTEIPDSQDSPRKPATSELSKPSLDLTTQEETDSTPRTRSRATRKRKAEESLQSIVDIDATTDARSQHKRFGSEELPEVSKLIGATDEVEGQAHPTNTLLHTEESEDDEAPEAITSKAASAPTPFRQRQARSQKSTPKAIDNESALNAAADLLSDATTPTLKIDTAQDKDSLIAPESEDSNDSAFATAQTSRHIDVFSTPQGGTPQNQSPALGHFNTIADDSAIVDDIPGSSLVKFTDAAVPKPSRSKIPTRANPISSVALPRRSGNTLEKFRRHNLLSRAQGIDTTSRKNSIRFQEDWPGKRRKFVVGY